MQNENTHERMPKKRRKKRKMSIIPAVITLLICLICALLICIFIFYKQIDRVSGTYTRKIDITESVIADSSMWLTGLNNANISTEKFSQFVEPITISVSFELIPESLGHGQYKETIDESSYNEARENAYSALSDCLTSVIIDRLINAGYADSLSEADASKLITDTLGMTLEEYLEEKGISIIPEYETLTSQYNDNGDYSVSRSEITLNGQKENKTVSYLSDKNTIIFPTENIIYMKEVD